MSASSALLLVNPRARLGQRDLRLALDPIERAGIRIIRPDRPLEVWAVNRRAKLTPDRRPILTPS
jgi:hypothetical protein